MAGRYKFSTKSEGGIVGTGGVVDITFNISTIRFISGLKEDLDKVLLSIKSQLNGKSNKKTTLEEVVSDNGLKDDNGKVTKDEGFIKEE